MYKTIYEQKMLKDAPAPFSLPAWISLAPFEQFLGMEIQTAIGGRAVLTMPFVAAHCQGAGLMHGGAIAALADTAMAIAIKTILPEGSHFATIDMKLEFHAPIRWGTVSATAVVCGRDERDIHGEVKISTEEGVDAVTFKATFRVKRSHNSQNKG